jgi:hypothetical protein
MSKVDMSSEAILERLKEVDRLREECIRMTKEKGITREELKK